MAKLIASVTVGVRLYNMIRDFCSQTFMDTTEDVTALHVVVVVVTIARVSMTDPNCT
jgi:hypothetical protein